MANVELGVALTPDHVFRIGSVTQLVLHQGGRDIPGKKLK
jgi:hypothetical protein